MPAEMIGEGRESRIAKRSRAVESSERTWLTLLALALGGFAIGATEFVAMGLLPSLASDLLPGLYAESQECANAQAGWIISAYALGVVVGAPTIAAAAAQEAVALASGRLYVGHPCLRSFADIWLGNDRAIRSCLAAWRLFRNRLPRGGFTHGPRQTRARCSFRAFRPYHCERSRCACDNLGGQTPWLACRLPYRHMHLCAYACGCLEVCPVATWQRRRQCPRRARRFQEPAGLVDSPSGFDRIRGSLRGLHLRRAA